MARPDSSQGQTAVNHDSDATVPDMDAGFVMPAPATASIAPVTLHAALTRIAQASPDRAAVLSTRFAPLDHRGLQQMIERTHRQLRLAGFGRDHVRMVEVDDAFAMRPAALADAIDADLAAGRVPCAVVGAVGGTATTSMDPVAEIAAIAGRHRLWLHVDAAMAGSAMILPECRWMWDGIEGADSLVVNAHKWLGVPFDCSLYFVRDEAQLLRVMSVLLLHSTSC